LFEDKISGIRRPEGTTAKGFAATRFIEQRDLGNRPVGCHSTR
jgi:hypothetical protein